MRTAAPRPYGLQPFAALAGMRGLPAQPGRQADRATVSLRIIAQNLLLAAGTPS